MLSSSPLLKESTEGSSLDSGLIISRNGYSNPGKYLVSVMRLSTGLEATILAGPFDSTERAFDERKDFDKSWVGLAVYDIDDKEAQQVNRQGEPVGGSVPLAESALRSVKVTFADGSTLTTSMAANLTDEQIREYYAPGSPFNVGSGEGDRVTKVKSVEILA